MQKLQAKETEYIRKLNYMEEDLQAVKAEANKYRRKYDEVEQQMPKLMQEIDNLHAELGKGTNQDSSIK